MRVIILLNPTAKRGKARVLLERALKVFRRENVQFDVRQSQSSRHLTELAKTAAEEKPDLIVSAGGDGTHHYVINGLFGSEVPLGFLPMGTGNDFGNGVGMPPDVQSAAAAVLTGQVRAIDVARAGTTIYGCIAGMGFDSTVTRYANEHARWLNGSLAYTWSLLRCMHEYRPQQLEIITEGESFSGDVVFAVVGNNVSYGGGIRLAPRAKLNDGLLDICVVPYMSRLELLTVGSSRLPR